MPDSTPPPPIVADAGQRLELNGKTPLMLDDPGVVWTVLDGRVEVYAVRIQGSETVGTRRHLYTVSIGEILIGLPMSPSGLALQAVGLPGTVVAPQETTKFLDNPAEGDKEHESPTDRVDRILLGLSAGLSRDIAPKPGRRTSLTSGQRLDPAPNESLRPESGAWWLVPDPMSTTDRSDRPSSLRYLGLEDFDIGETVSGCVLTPETWVETTGLSKPTGSGHAVVVLDTPALVKLHGLSEGLQRFGEVFFRCLDMELRLADAEVYAALHTRAQSARRFWNAGLERLEAVLEGKNPSKERPQAPEKGLAPLAAAMKLVLQAGNIRISDATIRGDEDIKDLATAWGVMWRPVALRTDWWRRDGGPLLGFLGTAEGHQRPLALLQPGPGRYEAVDPATGQVCRVTRAMAGRISSRAVTFHRPLPVRPMDIRELLCFAGFGARRDFLFIVACGLALALLAVIPPLAVKLIFSDIIPAANRLFLAEVAILLAVVAVSVFAVSLTRIAALQRMVGRMDFQLEPALWDRLIRLPTAFHRSETPGDLAERAEGLNLVRVKLCDTFLTAMLSGIFASSNVVMLFIFSPRLAFPALGLLLLGALAGMAFNLRQLRS
ncbi:MAG: hypothetical protein EOM25_13460, partial [Deltaproteobacteria bacterium]|nr:hypothetical protein [Deltaproteobacteria bacterium]